MDRGTAEEQRVAQEAWRKYELLTSSLSQELCEQLRLVLEPSLATKLKYAIRKGRFYSSSKSACFEPEFSGSKISCKSFQTMQITF